MTGDYEFVELPPFTANPTGFENILHHVDGYIAETVEENGTTIGLIVRHPDESMDDDLDGLMEQVENMVDDMTTDDSEDYRYEP